MGAKTKNWRPSLYSGTYWQRFLYDRAVNMFRWEGLPDTINLAYYEGVKQIDGFVVWCKAPDGTIRAFRGSVYNPDCYGWPTQFTIANHVYGNISGTLGVDGVLDGNTKYYWSSLPLIEKYASMLEELDSDIRVNLFNTKTCRIFPVKNEGQAQQIRHLLDTATETSVPAYIVSSSMRDPIENSHPIYTPVDYMGKDLLEGKLLTLNEFYAAFGIDGTPVAKRERLTDDEVQSNNAQLEINAASWLEPRRKTIKELERVFGLTGISVELNTDVVNMGGIVNEQMPID